MHAKRHFSSLRPPVNSVSRSVASRVRQFFTEDDAQDLIEYALIAAFIGIAGWAVLMTLPGVIGTTFGSWQDTTTGVPGQWDPPEPAAAAS